MTIAIYEESFGVSLGLTYDPLLEVVDAFDLGWALTPGSRLGNRYFLGRLVPGDLYLLYPISRWWIPCCGLYLYPSSSGFVILDF